MPVFDGLCPAMTKQGIGRKSAMKSITIGTLALLAATPALAQQGVSPTEIVIGTAQDLSGPVVNFSKAAVNGMRMRLDEINAGGGIQGRKLRLIVEDHGYDPKK